MYRYIYPLDLRANYVRHDHVDWHTLVCQLCKQAMSIGTHLCASHARLGHVRRHKCVSAVQMALYYADYTFICLIVHMC